MARRVIPDLGHLLLAFTAPFLIRIEFVLLACAIAMIYSDHQLTWQEVLRYDIVHIIMHSSIVLAIVHVLGVFYTICLSIFYYAIIRYPTKTYTMHARWDPSRLTVNGVVYPVRGARFVLYEDVIVPHPRATRPDAANALPTR